MWRIGCVAWIGMSSVWGALSWSEPITLSNSNLNAIQADLAASNATGHAIAAWVMERDADSLIQVSLFDGSSWSMAISLSEQGFSSSEPAVGINSLGHSAVIWRRETGSSTSVVEAAFYDGNDWSDPVEVSDVSTVEAVRFMMHPAEDAGVAVWRLGSGIASVQASLFNGSAWSAPATFAPESAPIPGSIAINGNGTAVLTWVSGNLPTKSVELSTYSGSWAFPITPASADSDIVSSEVAIDPIEDAAVAIWSNLNVIQVSFWNGMSWGAANNLDESSSFLIDEAIAYHPTNHSVAAVWRTSGAIRGAIYASSNWSTLFTLGEIGFSPDLAFNPTDDRVGVVWKSNNTIQYSEFSEMGVSDPVDLSKSGTQLEAPKIRFDAEGHATVIWSLFDGNHQVTQVVRGS